MAEELKEQVEKTQEKTEKKRRPRKERHDDSRADKVADEFVDRVVHVNRVSKTVKGGKRFAFAALVVVGDQKGRVGFAHAKSKEVPDAIKKATERARHNLIRVPLREGRTLHHDAIGHFGAGQVTLRTAPAGTGIIAGGAMRAVLESAGIKNVLAKSKGSSNPHNLVKATVNALLELRDAYSVAQVRGISMKKVFNG